MTETISYDDFMKVDIRVGQVVKAEPFEKARKPAYKLWVDFGGELGVKKSSAQLTRLYQPEDLVGRQVFAVVNFPPRQIADFMSEILVLGAMPDEQTVILARPDSEAPLGSRLL